MRERKRRRRHYSWCCTYAVSFSNLYNVLVILCVVWGSPLFHFWPKLPWKPSFSFFHNIQSERIPLLNFQFFWICFLVNISTFVWGVSALFAIHSTHDLDSSLRAIVHKSSYTPQHNLLHNLIRNNPFKHFGCKWERNGSWGVFGWLFVCWDDTADFLTFAQCYCIFVIVLIYKVAIIKSRYSFTLKARQNRRSRRKDDLSKFEFATHTTDAI